MPKKIEKYSISALVLNNVENPILFTFIYIFSAVGYVFQILQFIYMGVLTDTMTSDNFVLSDATFPLAMVLGSNIVAHILWRLATYVEACSIPTFMHAMRCKMMRETLSREIGMFTNELAGAISSRMGQLCMSIRAILFSFQWMLMGVLIETAVTIYYAFSVSVFIGGLVVVWVASSLSFSYLFVTRNMYENIQAVAKYRGESSGYRTDLISNIGIVLTTNWFKNGTKYFDEMSGELRDVLKQNTILYNWLFVFLVLMEVTFLSSIVYFSARLVGADALTVGGFVTVVILMFRVSMNVWTGSLEVKELLDNRATALESIEFLDKYNREDLSSGTDLVLKNAPSLEFKDVTFAYKSASAPLFDGFNLNIKSGEKVAFVGHSGAGKSSVVNLALAFYEPSKGELLVNGENVKSYSKNSYRNHMSVISQDTSLFHQSIRDNIGYGMPHATEEDIINAAKKAHAHEFITKLEKGYDSMVGDRGVQLSGGQRQRIAIARAILKNAPIFILDEATSALDSQSERYIQQSLHDVMQNKTVIAIAHRLSTISEMDRIVVMDAGRIVEEGPHEELLKKGGVYAKMWAMQSGGFLPEE